MVSYKYRLRQAISWHQTEHTKTQTPLSLFLWRVHTVHPFLSYTCSFSLILSNHLMLNSYHIWFNYSTSPLNLLSLSLSLSPYSSFLYAAFSSWSSNITLINCVSLFFSFSHHPQLWFPHCVPHSSPVSLTISFPFSAVIASLFLSISLSPSLICSESVIYTATTHAE